jgi:hypothetical protein
MLSNRAGAQCPASLKFSSLVSQNAFSILHHIHVLLDRGYFGAWALETAQRVVQYASNISYIRRTMRPVQAGRCGPNRVVLLNLELLRRLIYPRSACGDSAVPTRMGRRNSSNCTGPPIFRMLGASRFWM